jgi:hypothetical protein
MTILSLWKVTGTAVEVQVVLMVVHCTYDLVSSRNVTSKSLYLWVPSRTSGDLSRDDLLSSGLDFAVLTFLKSQ